MDKQSDFELMDFDRLWFLYENLTRILAHKIAAEKIELEKRLAQLNSISPGSEIGNQLPTTGADQPKRKYPKVLPKYFNPSAPTETWSGRGKQPRWLVSALQSGSRLDDFLIANKNSIGKKLRRSRQS